MLERSGSDLTLAEQADLLSMSRSSLYYVPRAPSEWEVQVKHRIDTIYTDQPFYGSRRIRNTLQEEGFDIGRDAVRQFMREMGLEAIYPKPDLSKPAPENKVYPYLLRGVKSAYPNHVWGIDITYIRLQRGWMYLVAILDWYSRYIVSWELSETLEIAFVLTCVDRALSKAVPTIFNSDQGSHFTSPQCVDRVLNAGAKVSMDGRGRAMDNIFTERLWRTVKYEHVYLNDYAFPREARLGIGRYLRFYCEDRPHQSLGYKRPVEIYRAGGAADSREVALDVRF
jgi:putative transposase